MWRLVPAGLLTGVIDALFSSVLAAFVYGSTVTRLWQGVASVLLGAAALDGGMRTAVIGLLMHFGVAFGWSAVFLLLVLASSWLRGVLASPYGVLAIASVYGPVIWMTMSLVLIPLFTHRPPAINSRWCGSSSSATSRSSRCPSSRCWLPEPSPWPRRP